jgi:hypothetical protein
MSSDLGEDDLTGYAPAWVEDSEPGLSEADVEKELIRWHNANHPSPWSVQAKKALIESLRSDIEIGATRSKQRYVRQSEMTKIQCVACPPLHPIPKAWESVTRPAPIRKGHTTDRIMSMDSNHPDYPMISYALDHGMLVTMSVDQSCPLISKPTWLHANGIDIPDQSRFLLEHGVPGREVFDLENQSDQTIARQIL